ncbi:DMT family transporter [Parabacteroides bouchesdurhonensis]|uniref:DMT family transporter n=1 Tax=Parabacteroides bouchesdurhonensis TaxID=1936995 RepID=UPI000C867CBA|nr:multidrug efflux SMR transporter [Parabacteroides bouchesdurhonensis]
MGWIYLLLGGLFEIGWPVGMKLAQTTGARFLFLAAAVISMALSGYFLYMVQRTIPIGTAYVVWTGIGAIGTLLIGIFFFHDSAGLWRMLSALLIIVGIIGLKLAS